ncbi:hypothetical protein [Peribacillus muralis]|uniref:hypothetical protein n=1 Tax=Peribacillus muralis TaxID=264697 RepID=UPI003671DEAB
MVLDNAVVTVTVDGEQKEKFSVNLPGIRSLKGFLKGEWNLAAFDSCFPGRNRVGDVDGSIELNGHTLHIEFKDSKWSMNQGQVLKAIRQAKYSGIATIFVFGKTNVPREYLLFTPDNLQPDFVECELEGLQTVLTDWARNTTTHCLIESKTDEWKLVDKYFGRAA